VEKALRLFIVFAIVLFAVYYFRGREALVPVEIAAGARLADQALSIAGTTSLEDGAILLYEVFPKAGEMNLITGRTTVANGRFAATINVGDLAGRDLRVRLIFQVALEHYPQPPEVILRYGVFGQHMTGELVVERAIGRRAELVVVAEKDDR
jgi:hypothetical protein